MQTFLPLPSFRASAACLDDKRLGKQRVEALQIYRSLTIESYGWKNHPAVKMWKGHELWLMAYHDAVIDEWVYRGFNNNMELFYPNNFHTCPFPQWWGDDRLHSSHRAALLFKDFESYREFGWAEEPKIDYWWPTKEG